MFAKIRCHNGTVSNGPFVIPCEAMAASDSSRRSFLVNLSGRDVMNKWCILQPRAKTRHIERSHASLRAGYPKSLRRQRGTRAERWRWTAQHSQPERSLPCVRNCCSSKTPAPDILWRCPTWVTQPHPKNTGLLYRQRSSKKHSTSC